MPVEDDAEDFRVRVRTAQRFLCLHIFLLYILKMLLPVDTFSSYSYDTALRISIISRYIFVCMSNVVDIQLLDMSPNIRFNFNIDKKFDKNHHKVTAAAFEHRSSTLQQSSSAHRCMMTKIYRSEQSMPSLSPLVDSYVIELSSKKATNWFRTWHFGYKKDANYFVVKMRKGEYDRLWFSVNSTVS
mmetsp:Transcript_46788/g.146703  ORF Transcript_46788/g.146703 Transcript_46788/m.146703 type:complete len:186 (-) Transcript_46788:595-1152(-)